MYVESFDVTTTGKEQSSICGPVVKCLLQTVGGSPYYNGELAASYLISLCISPIKITSSSILLNHNA